MVSDTPKGAHRIEPLRVVHSRVRTGYPGRMRVRVLTFGVLRERLGVSEETVELAEMFPDDLALHGREGAR